MTDSMDFSIGWIDPSYAQSTAREESKNKQAYENSARPATVSFSHTTIGTGDFVDSTLVRFGVAFVDRPAFTSGLAFIKLPDPKFWKYPWAQAAIYRWEQDSRGNYIGAYLVYTIGVPPVHDPHQAALELEKNRQDEMYENLRIGIYETRAKLLAPGGLTLSGVVDAAAEAEVQRLAAAANRFSIRTQRDLLVAQVAATTPLVQADVVIEHHLSFYGTAVKILPDNLYAEMQQL